MPINRAPFDALVDDTGDGLSGSVWNKAAIQSVLLDPIDAADAAIGGTVSTWAPFDSSGAGLVFTVTAAHYIRIGRAILIWLHLAYPVTGSTARARISGIPTLPLMVSAMYVGAGTQKTMQIFLDGGIYFLNATSAVDLTNQDLSGSTIIAAGLYIAS